MLIRQTVQAPRDLLRGVWAQFKPHIPFPIQFHPHCRRIELHSVVLLVLNTSKSACPWRQKFLCSVMWSPGMAATLYQAISFINGTNFIYYNLIFMFKKVIIYLFFVLQYKKVYGKSSILNMLFYVMLKTKKKSPENLWDFFQKHPSRWWNTKQSQLLCFYLNIMTIWLYL